MFFSEPFPDGSALLNPARVSARMTFAGVHRRPNEGAVAQLGARKTGSLEVTGSTPVSSTIFHQ